LRCIKLRLETGNLARAQSDGNIGNTKCLKINVFILLIFKICLLSNDNNLYIFKFKFHNTTKQNIFMVENQNLKHQFISINNIRILSIEENYYSEQKYWANIFRGRPLPLHSE